MAITKDPQDTKKSEQNVFNNTYDTDFDVLAIELLGYFSDNQTLQRIAVDSNGYMKVTV